MPSLIARHSPYVDVPQPALDRVDPDAGDRLRPVGDSDLAGEDERQDHYLIGQNGLRLHQQISDDIGVCGLVQGVDDLPVPARLVVADHAVHRAPAEVVDADQWEPIRVRRSRPSRRSFRRRCRSPSPLRSKGRQRVRSGRGSRSQDRCHNPAQTGPVSACPVPDYRHLRGRGSESGAHPRRPSPPPGCRRRSTMGPSRSSRLSRKSAARWSSVRAAKSWGRPPVPPRMPSATALL